MTEDEARSWLANNLNVPRETMTKVHEFIDHLKAASTTQNLISASTVPRIWERHVVDSAQLLCHATAPGHWIDVGSGAGFPGMIVAILTSRAVTLIESRTLRATFLRDAAVSLDLSNVEVICASVESVRLPPPAILSARAVAPLERLLTAANHLAVAETIWLLSKGRNAASELAVARNSWQGIFAMKPSVTDPEAAIIVARNVARRVRA